MTSTSHAVRILAPEDVRPGDVVVVMSRVVPWIEDLHDLISVSQTGTKVPNQRTVLPDDPEPIRVEHVSVPLVFGRTATDSVRLLDLRQCTVGRVDPTFGAVVMDAISEAKASSLADGVPELDDIDGDDEAIRSRWRRWLRRGR